jgi:hypothetical protein
MCVPLNYIPIKVNVDSPQHPFERLPPGLGPKWVKMGQNRVKNGVEWGGKNRNQNRKIEIRKCKNWDKKSKKMGQKIKKMGAGTGKNRVGKGRKKNNK